MPGYDPLLAKTPKFPQITHKTSSLQTPASGVLLLQAFPKQQVSVSTRSCELTPFSTKCHIILNGADNLSAKNSVFRKRGGTCYPSTPMLLRDIYGGLLERLGKEANFFFLMFGEFENNILGLIAFQIDLVFYHS